MSIYLNAYPLDIGKGYKVNVAVIPYTKETLDDLRSKYSESCVFNRSGNDILCLSRDGTYDNIGGQVKEIALDSGSFTKAVIKDAIKRLIDNQGKNKSVGFSPIQVISSKSSDDIITRAFKNLELPFSAFPKYEIDIRHINGRIFLIIDCSVKLITNKTCDFFLTKGFNVIGKRVFRDLGAGNRSFIGIVTSYNGLCVNYVNSDNIVEEALASELYLDASNTTVSKYLSFEYKAEGKKIKDTIVKYIKTYNKGNNKSDVIEKFSSFIKKKGLCLIDGHVVKVGDRLDISKRIQYLSKPQFIFDNNNSTNYPDNGIKEYGPYTKSTFDRNNPSICVICSQKHQGRVEQFVIKFLKGIANHKTYSKGFEARFCVGSCKVKTYTFSDSSPESYKRVISQALKDKAEEKGNWDLALVQVENEFKSFEIQDNPYFVAKSFLITQSVPVQEFTIELLSQADYNLGYSLNNMALASYSKMGGTPWVLKSSQTVAHEVVIGIGSSNIYEEGKNTKDTRLMGITTVFTGSGQYMVSNTSNAVSITEYKDELAKTLKNTILRLKSKLNWISGDTIRIVFHSSVKQFNKFEVEAVKEVIDEFQDYKIEYAFLKVSQDHFFQMFDTNRNNDQKGGYAPTRGQSINISDYDMLTCLKGGNELKTIEDGHPKCLLTSVHPSSTFKDIRYLTNQLFSFSFQSWRSYFPAPLPVTIMYSDLIAYYLGWFGKLPSWDSNFINNRAGMSKWFL